MNALAKMDAQYRFQRYIYDASRKFYLFGRDTILNEINLQPEQSLLEVGCGTARNLCKFAACYPQNRLYGLDASELMLKTAQRNLERHQLDRNIKLKTGLAQSVTPAEFGLTQAFDHILFSFVLSMIPDWPAALEQAIANLKPGGKLHIVDFSDQAAMPGWFRGMLSTWLGWFDVNPDSKLPDWLAQLPATLPDSTLEIRHLVGRYCLIAHFTKP